VTAGIDFHGRVAIITGAGRGLGREYAHELARRGATVVVHDSGADVRGDGHNPEPAESVVGEIITAGGSALACTTDASTEAGGQSAVDLALESFGRVDVVVANAGTIYDDPYSDWPTAQFEAILRHHVHSAFHVTRPAFAAMKTAGYGRLVFVSSAAGVFGQPGLTGYATAKTGMLGLMNVAAIEGAEFGIKANAVMPMGNTRMASALLGEAAESPDAQAFLNTMRLDQVSPVVAFLASADCTLTHTVLSAFSGRVATLHVAITPGWISPTGPLTAEDVQRELATITDTDGMFVPGSIFDELGYATGRLAEIAAR
jgi:NAD(P)-dependent dehydrogenase (short-subunit alcohol dehydrogenase family)